MRRPFSNLTTARHWIAIWLMVAVAAAVYFPGLGGGFIFDDWVNLNALGRYGPVRDVDSLLRYLTSGIADPTGRPVSMASFLLDAQNWPADPRPFKRTNVLLHVLSGLALYSLLKALGERLTDPRHARVAALFAAAIWLLHPMWVATVLYVVQRQAMLSALFVLIGLRLWVASDHAFRSGFAARGWWLGSIAVLGFGLLAGLSKANGFLLPLLVLALNATVIRLHDNSLQPALQARRARTLLAVIPAALVVTLLAATAFGMTGHFSEREWTIGERLLSQPRALSQYAFYLAAPFLEPVGLFSDAFAPSTGFTPAPTTALALLALAATAIAGWRLRATHPAASCSILFFFAGHAMESGAIPLELYFEHRNYLPASLFFWAPALALTSTRILRTGAIVLSGFALVCALSTFKLSALWGHPDHLALHWADRLPESPRAQASAAQHEMRAQRPDLAITRLAPLVESSADQPQLTLNLLDATCAAGRPVLRATSYAEDSINKATVRDDVVHQWLVAMLLGTGSCHALNPAVKEQLVRAALTGIDRNQTEGEDAARSARLQALLALDQNDCKAAARRFESRIDSQRRPELAYDQVGLLASRCGPEVGLKHLRYYLSDTDAVEFRMPTPMLRLRDHLIRRQGLWEVEWQRLEDTLIEEVGQRSLTPSSVGGIERVAPTNEKASSTSKQ
ncbi:hypothetical protein WCE34_03685 [Luteimonas sp. MJ204]|uniref:hypothetical protein n=1 Tax=Luteimonas sp. MJ145 TaxID=3129234 RepID=UPI0031BBB9BF